MILSLTSIIIFTVLCLIGRTANLLSMGSNDFNLIIDGAVVMVGEVFAAFCCKTHERGTAVLNLICF